MKISLLIYMKMPTIVGIFIFISRENFMLSLVKHEKSFITSGHGLIQSCGIVNFLPYGCFCNHGEMICRILYCHSVLFMQLSNRHQGIYNQDTYMQADYSKMYIQRKVSTIWSGSVFAIE